MSDLIIRTAARAELHSYAASQLIVSYTRRAIERFQREQTGQDLVEYGGVLLVVAAIIVAMVTFGQPIASAIEQGILKAIKQVFNA